VLNTLSDKDLRLSGSGVSAVAAAVPVVVAPPPAAATNQRMLAVPSTSVPHCSSSSLSPSNSVTPLPHVTPQHHLGGGGGLDDAQVLLSGVSVSRQPSVELASAAALPGL